MNRMKSTQPSNFRERVRIENRIAQQFNENWGWLVEELDNNRKELQQKLNLEYKEDQQVKSASNPIPRTSAAMVGWLSTRPDCQLEVFGPDCVQAKPLPDIYVVTRLNDPLSDGLEYADKLM